MPDVDNDPVVFPAGLDSVFGLPDDAEDNEDELNRGDAVVDDAEML